MSYSLAAHGTSFGALSMQLNTASLSDAKIVAQSVSTLLGISVKLTDGSRYLDDATRTDWEWVYTPGSQGTTVPSPSSVTLG